MKVELIQTRDGSHSLLVPEMNETYHSTHGAITESQYVFIKQGLEYYLSQNPDNEVLNVFEVGFGTGLNALLTAEFATSKNITVKYTSLEKNPLAGEVIEAINYPSLMGGDAQQIFNSLHDADWGSGIEINAHFELEKIQTALQDYSVEGEKFNVVFFDAFAPSKQPEMWAKEMLQKTFDLLLPSGVLVTYCAQGQFKRDLTSCGFEIEKLPGPPGKAEMTRAEKS